MSSQGMNKARSSPQKSGPAAPRGVRSKKKTAQVTDVGTMILWALCHVTAIIAVMYLVFYAIDRVNTAMEFINNDITKWLIAAFSVGTVAVCGLAASGSEKPKAKLYTLLIAGGLLICSGYSLALLSVDYANMGGELFSAQGVKRFILLYSLSAGVFAEVRLHILRKQKAAKPAGKTARKAKPEWT